LIAAFNEFLNHIIMKHYKLLLKVFSFMLFIFTTLTTNYSIAQPGKNAGGAAKSRPAPSASKPASTPSMGKKATPSAVNKPAASSRSTTSNKLDGDRNTSINKGGDRTNNINSNSGNRTTNNVSGNKKVASGNNVNVDKSRGDVNINIDNSKDIRVNNQVNTTVRHNNINSYNRPPYRYGGYNYYCYHPYVYHPYQPFYWGPTWHPWGFFVATLATTAIIVSVNNAQYHYDQGVCK
jgi:hypothetical protein